LELKILMKASKVSFQKRQSSFLVFTDYYVNPSSTPLKWGRCACVHPYPKKGLQHKYRELLSPVIIAGARTILEMMKSIPVSNNNLPIVHL